jgi:hypothetical protein
VAPLNAATALAALTDVDVELPVDGLARDLDLELLGDMGFVEGPPQSGQKWGKGASWTSSICSGPGGWRWALGP